MKFTVSSAAVYGRLQIISRVIVSKNSLPILDCILLELRDATLFMIASDKETTLSTSVEVNEADGEGRIAIPSKTFLDALREITDQPLTFDVDLSTLAVTIEYMNGKYNLVGQDAEEYPVTQAIDRDNANRLNIDSQLLLSGINHTYFATADNELHPVMNGINLDITTDDLTIASTDGQQLVRYRTTAAKAESQSSFILPNKPINMLRSFLPKEEGGVEICFDKRNAMFISQNYGMVCRLIEGRYPNYNSVIPKNNSNKAVIERSTFISALKRVSVFSSQASNLVKLSLDHNCIQLSAQDIDFSTSAQEMVQCLYDGPAMNIGFKSPYLIEILSNIDCDNVCLELSDPSRSGIIVPEHQEEKEEVLMLLMPMMVTDF